VTRDKSSDEQALAKGWSRRGFLGATITSLSAGAVSESPLGQQIRSDNPARGEVGLAPSLEHTTRIGNFHALMPGAVAFIQDDATGVVLDAGAEKTGRPGVSSPDFAYNRHSFELDGVGVTFEWGRAGAGAIVGRLKADDNVKWVVNFPANTWHPFFQFFSSVPHGLDAYAVTLKGKYVPWSLRVEPAPSSPPIVVMPSAKLEVPISPQRPGRLVAGFGELPELGAVDATIDSAGAKYQRERAQAQGDWGDFVSPITDNLNNSRMYSSLTKRVVNLIGRGGWMTPPDPDYLPLFTWDTSFSGLLSSMEDPATAKETIRAVLAYQQPDGMVGQFSDWLGEQKAFVSMRCSNPPVTSLCAWKLYQRWGDREFLKQVFPGLLRWHDWWPKHSDGNQNGLLEWGALNGGWKQARLGSGWDDTPHFNGSKLVGTQMNADAVDLNCLWSMDAEYLARIASALGLKNDAARLLKEHDEMNQRINNVLWNPAMGMYCSRLWDEGGKEGEFLTRLTPMNFYPLICGAPDAQRAKRMLALLTDPQKFWGRWLVPTLAYDDPEWPQQEYWKGHVWPPVNYLLWQGIRRCGTSQHQAEFARRSVDLFMRNWTARGTCNENYRSDDGTGDDLSHYAWGALLCQIGVEALYDIASDGRPIAINNPEIKESIELRNMPAGGELYRIGSSGGRVTIHPE
jgi:glycogen debranching enzyme